MRAISKFIKYRGSLYCRVAVSPKVKSTGFVWPSSRVSLEGLCADDFGACYKDEKDLTDYDHLSVENFEETCVAQEKMEKLVKHSGVDAKVEVIRTDDRDSCHQDCYIRFNLRDVETINHLLKESGLSGDILDIYDESVYDEWADKIERRFFWSVELTGN